VYVAQLSSHYLLYYTSDWPPKAFCLQAVRVICDYMNTKLFVEISPNLQIKCYWVQTRTDYILRSKGQGRDDTKYDQKSTL